MKIAGREIPDAEIERVLEGVPPEDRPHVLNSVRAQLLVRSIEAEDHKASAAAEEEAKKKAEADAKAKAEAEEKEAKEKKERERKSRPLYV